MHNKTVIRFLGTGTIVLLICAAEAEAGEIGTTSDGNVIYQFSCPPAGSKAEIRSPGIDWDNHLKTSDGLEWDADHGYSGFPFSPMMRSTGLRRSGQVLICTWQAEWQGYDTRVEYRYKVKRDIIQCKAQSIATQLVCILKSGSGGETGSSATSSSAESGKASTAGCCQMTANPELKGRLGRLVVAFPQEAAVKGTGVTVLKDGKTLLSAYGTQMWELLPGSYEVMVSNKRIPNVQIQAGHDTHVKVGVLRISAGKGTKAAVLDAGNELVNGYGEQVIGLPPGSFEIEIAGQREKVMITAGEIKDF
jgi:hypothetical protein